MLTRSRFESSIDAVIAELNLGLRVFAVDHAQSDTGVWTAVLTGPGGIETEISIDARVTHDPALVLDALRSQLRKFAIKIEQAKR